MTAPEERQPLPLPGGHRTVRPHSCCSPCSGEAMEAMLASGTDDTVFFHNPDIHPL
ncbi:epoxyqueuosine reductase QueH [Pseudorhodoferax sp.]|uniref:epoxyqueuosine reductase QueH n=1 Tax=Pseudorhodoferax sp. TaxID=1993553 RepID=UPI0039E51703